MAKKKGNRGSVYQDKNGRWRGVVDLPKTPGGPKRPQKTFYGDQNLSDAAQQKQLWSQINALVYEIENGLYLNETNETIEQYLNNWHKVYTGELQETTKQLYKMYIDKHIVPEIGHLKIKDLRPIQLKEFYNKKLETLSGKTVGKIHSFLSNALEDAKKNQLIKINPCESVNKPKAKKYVPTIYNEEQFNKLLSIVKGTFDEVCILLAGVCGLRRGEVFGLRLQDIDFKGSKISVVETMVRFDGKWIIKEPKTETSKRTIKVPEFVIEVINNYLTSLKIVPERICGEYKPDSYSKHFKNLLKKYSLPHIRFHDLRHFNATLMLKYGVPDKIASGRLGHSQVQTTREIYQHLTTDMDSQAADIIEGIFTIKENKKTEGN